LIRVPSEKKSLSTNQLKKNLPRLHHASANLFRKLVLHKMGITRNKDKIYRICNVHPIHEIEKDVIWTDTQQKQNKSKVKMNLPIGIGRNSSLNNLVTTERQMAKENRCNIVIDQTRQQLSDSRLLFSQDQRKLLNRSLEMYKNSIAKENTVSTRISLENCLKKVEKKPTYIKWDTTTNKYMKMSTGFPSKASFISFVCILCEGKMEKIKERVSSLTWYEEWMSYFTILWCKHVMRWEDAEFQFKISARTLRRIFDSKLQIHLQMRNKWPIFVTYKEDEKLRKQQWNDEYQGRRLIMWDNTNVPIYKPSDANNQRQTYSLYYNGIVAKGAVFIQPCGWSGTHELFPGAISDTEYMIRSGAINLHDKYLQRYDIENKEIKFHIMLDKGYRITAQCFEEGGQMGRSAQFCEE
jgi:hypothetical protein